MDFRLKDRITWGKDRRALRFNPCSNGLSAQRAAQFEQDLQAVRFQSLF